MGNLKGYLSVFETGTPEVLRGAPFKHAKSKVNELDTNNCYIKYTIFEGGNLEANKLECVVYESKAEPSGSGSHYKMVGHFHTKGDGVVVEEDVKGALKNLQMTFKAAEEYLVNNPHEYA